MGMRLKASEVAEAVDGHLFGPDVALSGVCIDSRCVAEGDLFVALVAARNGHQYIAEAVSVGAAAYMTSQGLVQSAAGASPTQASAIQVNDTAVALVELGSYARSCFVGPVVGITGSVGKTSVKDMAAAVIGAQRSTHASPRSFNNELGVPLTLLSCPDEAEVMVVEMGARGKGHIARLCLQARPTVGVVTAVGAAHTEMFGSIEAVVEAKGELIEGLGAQGVAVLNADQALVAAMASRTAAEVLTFGRKNGDVRASRVQLNEGLQPRFWLETPAGRAQVLLSVCGEHMVDNALAAAAVGVALGVEVEAIAAGLATARLSPWRMEVVELASGGLLINDTYNANPLSMAAGLHALARLNRRRRVAVLGQMAELGERSLAEHAAIGNLARELGIEVIAIGTSYYGTIPVVNADAVLLALGTIDADAAVLLKGSRLAGLEKIALSFGC